jgi:hypothetical protein
MYILNVKINTFAISSQVNLSSNCDAFTYIILDAFFYVWITCSCSEGTLRFKVSRYGEGYFVGCDRHPKCKYDPIIPQYNFNTLKFKNLLYSSLSPVMY